MIERDTDVSPKLPTSPLNSKAVLQLSIDFWRAPKPPKVMPVDVGLVSYLISRRALDHECFDSQLTLAINLSCDSRTIARSLERLKKAGWLTERKRRGRTSGLSLQLENLPGTASLRSKITEDAKQLAFRYMGALGKLKGKQARRKFPKGWLALQFPSAQRVLDMSGGNLEFAAKLVGHALSSPQHVATARKSFYNLFGRLPRISATYSQLQRETQDRRQIASQNTGRQEITIQ